jgi:VWFA-related protein
MRLTHFVSICGALILGVSPGLVAGAAAQAAERRVYVTVTDRDGVRVTDLTPADFSLREGGQAREIVSVAPATARMRMAILVEESLTPTGGVRLGLAEFIQRMQPHAEMSLVVMGLRNFVLVDYTTDVGALFAAIQGLAPVGFQQQVNNVPEGVYEAARAFERDRPERPVMVVVAREMMQQSSEEPQHVLNQIGRSGAVVEVVTVEAGQANIGVGNLNDMSGRAQILGDGSRQSGGRRIEVSALTAVPRALQQVADSLLSQYVITYVLPAGARPSDRLNVSLERRGLTLRAPTRIAPAAVAPGD